VTPRDPAYTTCHALLEAIKVQSITLFEPWLVLAEVAGPVSRMLRDPMRGRVYADIIRTFPNIMFVALDESLAQAAADLAADHFLRGADAIYAAVAQRYNVPLISLDDEHRQRLQKLIPVLTPAQALAML